MTQISQALVVAYSYLMYPAIEGSMLEQMIFRQKYRIPATWAIRDGKTLPLP
jgi:hypothetical protein